MYRNTYLQLYKQSLQQEESLATLLRHFNQLYSALGCVLQDLQYQIGKQSFHPHPHKNSPKLQKESDNIVQPQKPASFKQIIKVQDNSHLPDQYNFLSKQNKLKKSPPQHSPKHSENSQSSSSNGFFSIKQVQKGLQQQSPLQIEKVRADPAIKGSDSFDSLFDPKKNDKINQNSPYNANRWKAQPLEMIPQAPNENSNSQIDNTYEDFLERIFRDTQSRKSR